MAHSISANKRIRQNVKRKARNRRRMVQLKTALKEFGGLLTTGKADQAAAQFPKVCKTIDQVAAKGTIHRNAAARYKSRLAKRLAVAKAPKA